MGLTRAAHEIRAAVHIFLSRLDHGEVNAAPSAAWCGHEFVVPEVDADPHHPHRSG